MTAAVLHAPAEAGSIVSHIQNYALPFAYGAAIFALTGLFVIYLILIERKITPAADGENEPLRDDAGRSRELGLEVWKLAIAEAFDPRNESGVSWFAAYLGVVIAVVACAALLFGPAIGIADLNIGLFFIVAVSSLGIFGFLLGSEPRNGKAAEATLQDGARWISFQVVAILGLISIVIFAGSFSLKVIVQAQSDQGAWFIFYAPVGFVIYFAASVMSAERRSSETPDHPARAIGTARIQGRGLRKALSCLAEYLNVIVVAGIAATVFFGGWLRPFARYHDCFFGTQIELVDAFPALLFLAFAGWCFWLAYSDRPKLQERSIRIAGGLCAALAVGMFAALFASPETMEAVHGAFWFCAKMAGLLYGFLWLRATVPSYTFERGVQVAWRVLVPLAAANLILAACAISMTQLWDFGPGVSSFVATLATLGFAIWLWSANGGHREPVAPATPADAR
ncbi:MAG: NADH-quinone oxidoreductase subunit H [Candidatus Acidiferrales bacterium]